ncbi:MAG: hypothetical protein JXB62_06300 [Pirellulales bacterium]|nr:hypothetical protein [Pirellulales bacterium]
MNHAMRKDTRPADDGSVVPFSSNAVRLSPRQWLIAATVLAIVCSLVPALWKQVEPFDPGPDYRIPYRLGYDYWMYDRYAGRVARGDRTLLVGDSVVWGHYVADDETLSHFLNELAGEDRFANMGVDGIHPVAMAGLVDYYGRPMADKDVILHCNLLWMSSRRHDLQIEKEFTFNHAELAPQFYPRIPCYRESTSRRLGIVVGRRIPFFGWTRHMRIAYFDGNTLPQWTIGRPYANLAAAVTLELPSPNESPSPLPVAKPWTEKRLARFHPEWVDLETSFQWRCFRQAIATLQQRGNRVFVVIGPFNEHMLVPEGLRGYQEIQSQAEAWLKANGVAHYASSVLPSECYADASHPLAEGYAWMAKELFESKAFRRFSARENEPSL